MTPIEVSHIKTARPANVSQLQVVVILIMSSPHGITGTAALPKHFIGLDYLHTKSYKQGPLIGFAMLVPWSVRVVDRPSRFKHHTASGG